MPQPFDRTPTKDVLLEDALRAFEIDARIPDVFRVDDDHGAMPALVHAPCVIDADDSFQTVFRRSLLQHSALVVRDRSDVPYWNGV